MITSFTTFADQLNTEGHGVIGEVRDRGVEITIESGQTRQRRAQSRPAEDVGAAALQEYAIVLTCGTYGNVIRVLPPLVITDDVLTQALDILGSAIRTCAAR
ncbi:4-aminobutyrate aminotransferase [Rhodococcus sp. B50]|nr:4-aminobutyrate aminotransferase [Rhodococcus sp. B50]